MNPDAREIAIELRRGLAMIAHALSSDAAPSNDATGGKVGCLTEAGMGITAVLVQIADAIHDLADAVRDRGSDGEP